MCNCEFENFEFCKFIFNTFFFFFILLNQCRQSQIMRSITHLAFMFLRHGTKHSMRDAIWDVFISKTLEHLPLDIVLFLLCYFFFYLLFECYTITHLPIPGLSECGLKKWRPNVRRGSKWLMKNWICDWVVNGEWQGCKGASNHWCTLCLVRQFFLLITWSNVRKRCSFMKKVRNVTHRHMDKENLC